MVSFQRAPTTHRLAEVKPLGSEAMMICTMSALYGCSEQQVIQRHTLIPFHLAFSAGDTQTSHAFSIRLCSRFSERATKIPKSLRYCPSCLAEDIDWHHFSFYRRHHQLMPVSACSKHGVRLLEAGAEHNNMLPSDPHFPVNEAVQLESDDLFPVAYRFRQIAEDLLDNPRPFYRAVVASTLRQVARSQGFKTGKPDAAKQGSLAHMLGQRSDADAIWIRRVLVQNCKQGCASPEKKLNKALFEVETGTSAVLLTALLLSQSADDAMQLLSDRSQPPPQKAVSDKAVSIEDFVSAFYTHGGNYEAIKAAVGISNSMLRARLAKLGLTNADRKRMFRPISSPSTLVASSSSSGLQSTNIKTVQALTAKQIIAIRLLVDGCLLDDAASRSGTEKAWLESYVCQTARSALIPLKHESTRSAPQQ